MLGVLTEQHGALLPHLERAEVGGAGTPGGLTPGPAQRTRATCHPWACAASGTSPGSPHPSPPLPLALLCGHWCMLESRVHVARGPLSRGRQKVLSALTPQSSGPRLTLCGSSRPRRWVGAPALSRRPQPGEAGSWPDAVSPGPASRSPSFFIVKSAVLKKIIIKFSLSFEVNYN